MSRPTYGLSTHTGHIGQHLLRLLLSKQSAGLINLVILHRPGSDTSSVPSKAGVELRSADMDNEEANLTEQIQGINVFLAAAPSYGKGSQLSLIRALSQSKDLKVFFPSHYGWPLSHREREGKDLGWILAQDQVTSMCRELKVPYVNIEIGILENWYFRFQQENTLTGYADFMNQGKPFSPGDYIAQGVWELSQRPPAELDGNTYRLIQSSHTGAEIAAICTKHFGKETTVTTLSQEAWQAMYDTGGYGALGAAVFERWGTGSWGYVGQPYIPKEYTGRSLSEWSKTLLPQVEANPPEV